MCSFRLWLAVTLVCCLTDASPAPDNKPRPSLDAALRVPPPLDDPVDFVQLIYPINGSVEKPPVEILTKIGIHLGSAERFMELYSDAQVCVESNGVTRYCSPVVGNKPAFLLRDLGNYTVRAYITAATTASCDIESSVQCWQSTPTTFSVVSEPDFDSYVANLIAQGTQQYSVSNLTLVQWAEQTQRRQADKLLLQFERDRPSSGITTAPQARVSEKILPAEEDPLELVIGIKTAVLTNFPLRQAIRQTWANASVLPRGVKVFFLGCRPFASVTLEEDPVQMENRLRRVREAIELEKSVYGDLLTDELDCDDTYAGLADKVKEFLFFAAANFAHAPYVMLADDDVYMNLDKIIRKLQRGGPPRRYYSGQVRAFENARVYEPIRETNDRYHLSNAEYPMNELPPFALGAYFFLSMDCAQFVAKNRRSLRGLGGMDDISVALWMLTIQVHAQRFNGRLEHLRAGPCHDRLSAFGDLSPLAIRILHSNRLSGRPFCHGFQQYTWLKPRSQAPANGVYRRVPQFSESLQFAVFFDERPQSAIVTVIVSTPSKAGVKLQSDPAREPPLGFMHRVCAQARLHFPGATSALASCADITSPLRLQLRSSMSQHWGIQVA